MPNGRYNYSIAMGWNLGNPTGVVNVDGTGMMILVQGPLISCTMTVTPS